MSRTLGEIVPGEASAIDLDRRNWSHQARSLIRLAVLAPSSHNTQPWLFRVSESTIDLRADRTRALPVNDPADRELTISCGCALMNLRVAAASQGSRPQVRLLPDAGEPDWLARVIITQAPGPPPADSVLAAQIERRRTYRKRFAPREVASSTLDRLVEAGKTEGAWLRPLLTGEVRRPVAALVAAGDAAQWANPGWRRELAAWMRPRRRGDGLTFPALAAPVTRLLVRTFDLGRSLGAKDRALTETAPLLAVLGTDSDQPLDWLAAGQALQRILLVACRAGLQASYLNQPIQVTSLRPRLQELVGGGFPQMLLRLGDPVEGVPAAPRRGIEDVIQDAAAEHRSAGGGPGCRSLVTDASLALSAPDTVAAVGFGRASERRLRPRSPRYGWRPGTSPVPGWLWRSEQVGHVLLHGAGVLLGEVIDHLARYRPGQAIAHVVPQ